MKWFHNFKIAKKLITAFVLVAIIAAVVGVVGIISIKTIDEKDTQLYEKMTVPIAELVEISTAFQRVRVNTRDIILVNTPAEIKDKEERIKQRRETIDTYVAKFEKTILSAEVRAAYDEFVQTRNNYAAYLDQLVQLAEENKDQEAFALLNGDMAKAATAEQEAIAKLVQMKVEAARKTSDDNTKTANTAIVIMLLVICGGMFLAIILGIYIARIISKPVIALVSAAEKISEGDLNVEIEESTKDEIGFLAAAFKKMTNNLNDVMTSINASADQVAAGSRQVSASSQALSQGATEQASSIEELTASIEEIAAQTKQNAVNATQANELSLGAQSDAAQGNKQMQEMLKAMDEINEASSNISKIIKVIDEIAFQTNILALNAAVEAARAGQHGKGFAVVAEEVRNLAARSANAAKETTALIEGSMNKVQAGTNMANDTANALNKIVEGIAKAASLVGEIATASNEQASAIAQINQGIMQVSQVVQTNSATSEESAAASEELSTQAEVLKEAVNRFKLKKGGNSLNKFEDLNPEIVKMLEDMSVKKKINTINITEGWEEAAAAKTKIALSEKEFGKY